MIKHDTDTFIRTLWDFYSRQARSTLPWRAPEATGEFDPYKIAVSELMLQQTQVERVIPYYERFMKEYLRLELLAQANLETVLAMWHGLGYNRRAKYLRDMCKIIQNDYDGVFPLEMDSLRSLPGIGHNTAAAIRVYSINAPEIFIETNIRTVYIHHFFKTAKKVDDDSIKDLLVNTLDRSNPREFYWALMDYGTHLKKIHRGVNQKSTQYVKQAPFAGSKRQLRALILRRITKGELSVQELQKELKDTRLLGVLDDLVREGLLVKRLDSYSIAD